MKNFINSLLLISLIHFLSSTAMALRIIEPKEGETVYQGQRLNVIVQPDHGEKWEEVLIEIVPMSFNFLTGKYKAKIEIPTNETGHIDFHVYAYDKSGKEMALKRSLFVKLPPNVFMRSIIVGEELMILYKAPLESSPEEREAIESDQLSVAGLYSDGVKRYIGSSSKGTTYTSSDTKVFTVDSEGKIKAQGLGKGNITVRHGKYSATVKVIVKPYSK